MSPIAVAEAFERAPLLAERIGEGDPDTLIRRARDLIAAMTEAQRVAVLDAHPRIGASVGLSARSAAEQRATETTDAATLTTPEQLEQLEHLNSEYERRFGFRFVVFVAGRPHSEIIRVMERRLRRAAKAELNTALNEVVAIAEDRWRVLLASGEEAAT